MQLYRLVYITLARMGRIG